MKHHFYITRFFCSGEMEWVKVLLKDTYGENKQISDKIQNIDNLINFYSLSVQ